MPSHDLTEPAAVAASTPSLASLEQRRALAASLDDPLNRHYRYPAARALLRFAGGMPFRPDHITYLHTLCGIAGALFLAFGSSTSALVTAFVLLEARMILDCYDGVLARAKNLSSQRGRTLDELGDAVGYIAIVIGMGIHAYRTHPGMSALATVLLGAVLVGTGAMSGHAYDFYKRRLGSALKEGRDAIADELEQKRVMVRAGNASWITRFGIWFDGWQVRLYEPRYRDGDPVATVLERVHRPSLRFLVKLVGLISTDNVLGLISLGVLVDRVFEVELLAIAYALVMFTTARLTFWRVLGGRS